MPKARDPVVAEAVALADGSIDPVQAASVLARRSHEELYGARDDLVDYLHHHVDDYQATAALQLIYRAIATKGWPERIDWRREMRLPKGRTQAGTVRERGPLQQRTAWADALKGT